MGLNSPEDVIQIQDYYPEDENCDSWVIVLDKWLEEKGWKIKYINGHLFDDSFYAVTGKTERGTTHICIYQNGEMHHDPHPSQVGLISELQFEVLCII